jgi:hypothetical protein
MAFEGWDIKSEGVGHVNLEDKAWVALRLEGLGNEAEKVVYGILFPAKRDMGVWED